MRLSILALAAAAVFSGASHADTVYPLDRATILAGSRFDFKVEFDGVVPESDIQVTINGQDYRQLLGARATYVEREKGDKGALGSALILRDVVINTPGAYNVISQAAGVRKQVTWDVYGTPAKPKAKNVIFLLGDGLSVSFRTGARIMSKGVTEGKANGRLNMDEMDRMAFIGTSSTDSIAVDSANSMSAYMTGHKSAINALGVYADRTPDSLDDPKVETIAEALRRTGRKSIGVVSTAELEDATPAAVVSHTRKRSDKAEIVGMFHKVSPEVMLGGGSAYFLPKSTPGSKRKDDIDYIKTFKDAGYNLATNRTELLAAPKTGKLLGLFNPGNMDTILDRKDLKKGTVPDFPDQPGLEDMTTAALEVLSKNKDGFFLMVEGASIDKSSHPLDFERTVYETIEFDKAVGIAREFAKTHPDTMIVVTGDHTHGVSLIGTVDDNKPGTEMREKVGTYAAAGFPNYTYNKGDGYPDKIDVSRRLMFFSNNFPDYYETFRPKMDGMFVPAVQNEKKQYVANEAYKDVPGAVLRTGNIPRDQDSGVHAVDDVVLQATGPGTEGFRGYMEESDVYRVLADALALAPAKGKAAKAAASKK